MNYFKYLQGVVCGDDTVFHLAKTGEARNYALTNIVLLGILFGLSDLLGVVQKMPDFPLDGKYLFITPALFSASGILTMMAASIGCTLVVWAAAKAFGGEGKLVFTFDLLGLSLVPFWLLAPVVNYTSRYAADGFNSPFYAIITGLCFIWSCIVLQKGIVSGYGLSHVRAVIIVTAVWIFCISAVYVLIP